MSRVLLWQPFSAGEDIAPYRIAKMGDADGETLQAAGVDDPLIGTVGRAGGKQGQCVDVARYGIADVEYGAFIRRGDPLTADRAGKATPLSGAGIHQFLVDGAAADADIAVAGIKLTDQLVGAWALTPNTAGAANLNASIHADGLIRIRTTTTGDRVIVTWRRPEHVVGTAEVQGNAGDIGKVHLGLAVY